MQVKLDTTIGEIEKMVSRAAKAAQTTRGNADKEIFSSDEEKLLRHIIELGHESILEHINFTYVIKGLSRACLQELARHRHTSPSVESTRYTLKKYLLNTDALGLDSDLLKDLDIDLILGKYANEDEVLRIIGHIFGLIERLRLKYPEIPNDVLKYFIPEFWPTRLTITMNVRELRHILKLRTTPNVLKEFRYLAHALFDVVPNEFKFLLEDCVHEARTES